MNERRFSKRNHPRSGDSSDEIDEIDKNKKRKKVRRIVVNYCEKCRFLFVQMFMFRDMLCVPSAKLGWKIPLLDRLCTEHEHSDRQIDIRHNCSKCNRYFIACMNKICRFEDRCIREKIKIDKATRVTPIHPMNK